MRSVVVVVLSVLAGACSAVVTFDRSKIGEGGIDASLDAGVDASIDGGACDPGTHAGCGQDELCCDQGGAPTCVATGAAQCSACGMGCDAAASSACVERECRCGDGAACSGATPLCDDAAGACVECLGAADCAGEQCVDGRCVECDPSDNSGCSGVTPICNPATSTCEMCTMAPDNCPDPLECTDTGVCGGCNESSDCTTRTTPICDEETTACRGCTDAAECMAEVGLDFCTADLSCAPCDPEDDAGCSGMTPVCRAGAGGALACAACTGDGDCASRAGTPICATTGTSVGACVACDADDESVCAAMEAVCDVATNTCVECNDDGDCEGTTPICDGGTCRGCNTTSECATGVCVTTGMRDGACGVCDPAATGVCPAATPICASDTATCVACTADAQCAAIGTAAPFCALGAVMMGRCVECDASDGDGCEGAEPFCSATTLACEGCTSDAQCEALDPTTPVCNGGACEQCEVDTDCPTGEVCATSGAMDGACGLCDPADSAECTSAAAPVCVPSSLTCAACASNADCVAEDSGFVCTGGECVCDDPGPGGSNRCTCTGTGTVPPTDECLMDEVCDRAAGTCS